MHNNLIVDSSNLYWRVVATSIQEISKVDDVEVYSCVITNFISRIKDLKKQFLVNDGKIYLLFDNPTSTIKLRKLIDENYKHARAGHYKGTKGE